ncbi:AraC-like DNA-binding protein [Streptomyces sp. V3I7]|nr:AraC-like DNA-binding protein [Streptomyces sp. V3I7]
MSQPCQAISAGSGVIASPTAASCTPSQYGLITPRHRNLKANRTGARTPSSSVSLRELIDERLLQGVTLDEAAKLVHAHPTHLVRAFSATFGIAPHQYLMARRIDRARRRLLDGHPPAQVAAAVGFHDQSHLTRHFKRLVGTTPGHYAAGGRIG